MILRNFFQICFLVILSFIVTACAVTSRTSSQLSSEMNKSIIELQNFESEYEKDVDKLIKKYNEYLKREEEFVQPINIYQEELKKSISELQNSPTAVLSIDSITGFPYYYNKRLGAVVRAHLGLGRAYIKKKNFKEAENNFTKAIEIVNKRGVNSFRLRLYQIEAYKMLIDIYNKEGQTGKALIAKLNMDLIDDYLKSEEGIKTYYLEKHSYVYAQEKFAEIDRYVEEVNQKRLEEADRQMREIMGAMTQVVSTMAQSRMDMSGGSRSGYYSPDMKAFEMNKMIFDMTMKIVSSANKSDSSQNVALNPMANVTLVEQLIDKRKGIKTFDIIKAFAKTAAELSRDEAISNTSRDIINLLDSLNEIRRAGNDAEKMINNVTNLANMLSAFQKQVQLIGVGDTIK